MIILSLKWRLLDWWNVWSSVHWSLGNSARSLEHLLKQISQILELSRPSRCRLAHRDWLVEHLRSVEGRLTEGLSSFFIGWSSNESEWSTHDLFGLIEIALSGDGHNISIFIDVVKFDIVTKLDHIMEVESLCNCSGQLVIALEVGDTFGFVFVDNLHIFN